MNSRLIILLSLVSAFLSIALGAFGAHGLKNILSPREFQIFETGVKYQFYHSLAPLIVCILYKVFQIPKILVSGWIFLLGNIFFSGSLYILSISHVKSWGILTPIGGMLYLIGWINMIFHFYKFRDNNDN